MNMEIIDIPNKVELKAIKHLYNSTSTDDARIALMCIKVEKETSQAANGMMISIIKTPDCLMEYAGKLIRFVKRPVFGMNIISIEDGIFPGTDKIAEGFVVNTRFGINAKLLVTLLKDLPSGTHIVIDFDSKNKPIKINTVSDSDFESSMIIMPIHMSYDSPSNLGE